MFIKTFENSVSQPQYSILRTFLLNSMFAFIAMCFLTFAFLFIMLMIDTAVDPCLSRQCNYRHDPIPAAGMSWLGFWVAVAILFAVSKLPTFNAYWDEDGRLQLFHSTSNTLGLFFGSGVYFIFVYTVLNRYLNLF